MTRLKPVEENVAAVDDAIDSPVTVLAAMFWDVAVDVPAQENTADADAVIVRPITVAALM